MTTYHQIIRKIYQDYLLEYTQKLIKKKYAQDPDFSRLLQPLKRWKNRDYQNLSVLSDISPSTLKRILGYAPATQVSPEIEAKIATYLGYQNRMGEFTKILMKRAYELTENL